MQPGRPMNRTIEHKNQNVNNGIDISVLQRLGCHGSGARRRISVVCFISVMRVYIASGRRTANVLHVLSGASVEIQESRSTRHPVAEILGLSPYISVN